MIWIIGGTINGTDISKLLISENFPVIVSVTTEYGKVLALQTGAEVIDTALNPSQMCQLINDRDIKLVIDASHPFATEVSQNAIEVSKECGVPYIRFERENQIFNDVTYLSNYNEVVEYLNLKDGNILLTTGSKHIAEFKPLGTERLFARVLSTASSISLCEAAGLKPSNIISLSSVCSKELNYALMKEFNIRYLITKESGNEGGIQEKIDAANDAGVEVIIITRPKINYPIEYNDYTMVLNKAISIIKPL